MSLEQRHLHLLGALGAPRTEMWNGREHLVVPVVALQESAIHAVNAKNREFVPAAALTASAGKWNGHPLVVDHPVRDGKQISAHDDGVLAAHGFGFIRSSAMNGKRLGMEAMIDPARLVALKQDQLLADLRAGKSIEVSVGAFVECNDKRGTHDGRDFIGEWTSITPDHLAFLPSPKVGACSIVDGCGTGRIAERYLVTAEGFEALSNPEGINQYSHGGGVGDTVRFNGKSADGKAEGTMNVKIVNPHSNADKVTKTTKEGKRTRMYEGGNVHIPTATVEMDRSKRGLEPLRFEAHHHTLSPVKGLSMNLKSLRAKMLALFDTPEQAASEEAAELIHYNAMRELLDQAGSSWDELSSLVDELIADEEENPTQYASQEEAETEVERARIVAIQMLLMAMSSTIGGLMSMTSELRSMNLPAPSDPRYMESFRAAYGKSISAANLKTIQAAHDASHDTHTATVGLGAQCNGMKLLAGKHCEVCNGTGQVKDGTKQQDCEACGGTGELKTMRAACGCGETTEAEMKTKVERIAALTAAGVKDLTEKTSDEVLTVLEAKVESDAKHATELKAAQDKQTEAETALRAAQASQIPAEELVQLRALAETKKQQDAAEKTELVAKLEPLKTLSKEQLEAKTLDELRTLAKYAKVEVKKDFSIIGMPVHRAAAESNDFTQYAPPDSYAAGIKTLQGAK